MNDLLTYAQERASQLGIPPALAMALIDEESGGNPAAVSHLGARGMTQVMPATMRQMGYDPNKASDKDYIDAGLSYLRQQYDRFGAWDKALGAYHAGPGAVERAGGVPNTSDGLTRTPDYVRGIMSRAGDTSAPATNSDPTGLASFLEQRAGTSGPTDGKSAQPFSLSDFLDQRTPPTATPDSGGDFMRGAKVALGQTMPIVKGVVGLAGATAEHALGAGGIATGVKNWGLRGHQEGMQGLQPLQKDTDELTTAWDKARSGDPGALLHWAQYGLGYALGQGGEALAMSLLGGAAGALAAPAAAPVAGAGGAVTGLIAKGAVKEFLSGLIEKAVVKEANALTAAAGGKLSAEQAVKQATSTIAREIGSTGALLAYGGVQELGTIYPAAEEQAASEHRSLTGSDLARVWGWGLAAGGVEGLTDKLGLNLASGKLRIPGAGTRPGAAALGALGGAAVEGGTEAVQTVMEHAGAGQPLADAAGLKDIINSAAQGALGGAAIGGGAAAIHGPAAAAVPPSLRERADAAFKGIGEARTIDEALAAASAAVPPVTLPSGLDAEGALARMERQSRRDLADQRMWGPGTNVYEGGAPPLGPKAEPGAGLSADASTTPGKVSTGEATPVEEEPFADRLITLRERLQDNRTRQAIRDNLGPEALNDVLYYAQAADDATLPGVTSDRMLALAEALVQRATLRPIRQRAIQGGAGGGAPRIGVAPPNLAIPLDTAPTGTVRVDAAGTAAPETRADVVSMRDRARAMAERQRRPDGLTAQAPTGGGPGAGTMVGQGVLTPGSARPAPAQLPAPPGQPGKRGAFEAAEAEQATAAARKPAEQEAIAAVKRAAEVPAPSAMRQAFQAALDKQAHEAATSPTNGKPEPTQPQKDAGNYAKGHVRISGMEVSIENPAGSTRSGKSAAGKSWSTLMRHHYGYVRGSIGRDKDHVDVFIQPGTQLAHDGPVYVVDQVEPATGRMDEHKAMMGFPSEKQARTAYLSNYDAGWKGLGGITKMTTAEFRTWVMDHKATKQPLSLKVRATETAKPETKTAVPETKQAPSETIAEPAHKSTLKTVDKGAQAALKKRGQTVTSLMDAERRFDAGERLFVFHDQSEEPKEAASVLDLRGHTADQMMALPSEEKPNATVESSKQDSVRTERENGNGGGQAAEASGGNRVQRQEEGGGAAQAAGAAPAPEAVAPSKTPKPEDFDFAQPLRGIERVPLESFGWYEQDDDYLYHVTSAPNADKIERGGFQAGQTMFTAGVYPAYSKGKTFFTDRGGVKFWEGRVEDQLSSQFDDPPEVAVLRVPKSAVASIVRPDETGTKDANHPAWWVKTTKLASMGTQFAQPIANNALYHASTDPKFAPSGDRPLFVSTDPRLAEGAAKITAGRRGDARDVRVNRIDFTPRNTLVIPAAKADEMIPEGWVNMSPATASKFASQGYDSARIEGGSNELAILRPSSRMLANNASGESAASQEAINRARREQLLGQQRVLIDRSGAIRPLIGPDAVDQVAGDGQVVAQRGVGASKWTVLSSGAGMSQGSIARALSRLAGANYAEGWDSVGNVDTPSTVESATEEVRSLFGEAADKAVTVVATVDDLPAGVREAVRAAGAQAVTIDRSRVYVVADRIPRGVVRGIVMHELGVHFGMDRATIDRLAAQVQRWAKEDGRIGDMARFALRAAEQSKSTHAEEEPVAYMVQVLVDSGMTPQKADGLVARFINGVVSALKELGRRMGMNIEVTPQDMVDFAYGAANVALERGVPQNTVGQQFASILSGIRGFDQTAARNVWADWTTSYASNLWFNGLRTQYAKAQAHPSTFGPVFEAANDYVKDTAVFARAAADKAPSILPTLDDLADLFSDFKKHGLLRGFVEHGAATKDVQTAGAMLRQGTLQDNRVYGRDELEAAGLNDEQQKLYLEARASIDQSLDDIGKSEIVRLAGQDGIEVRQPIMRADNLAEAGRLLGEYLRERAGQTKRPALARIADDIDEKVAHYQRLKAEGYAPVMRFGRHTVHIWKDKSQPPEFFGMYETNAEANAVMRELRQDEALAGMHFQRGLMSQEAYRLYAGFPMDALELFARATGAADNEVYQDFIRLTKNNRSVLKRLMKREGVAGYSEDTRRTLAAFIMSNSRMASGNLNLGRAKQAADDIPKELGDIKDDAINLVRYVQDPQEESPAIRGVLYANYIAGSVAVAATNLTQPLTMTLPYIAQFGGIANAIRHLIAAARMAASGKIEGDLAEALEQAEADGIVSPQEIHHLQAEAMSAARHPAVKKALFIWGSMFSLSEQFNRRVSFIAAWNVAREQQMTDPFEFAEKAVIETQGLYGKQNKMNWARGPIGSVALTFKQFSIHYLEFLNRMWRSGPEGKKAVGIALAILALTAGVGGLPFADDLDDLVDTLAQAMGYDFSSKKAKRRFVAETLGLGDVVADVATRGLTALPGFPMDMSMRMGMGNLLPGTGALLRSNTDRTKDVLEFAGPAGRLFQSALEGGGKVLAGDVAGAGMGVAPLAVQNMAKAAQMWNTGEYRNTKGQKVMNVDAVDATMKFIGFQPAQVARESMIAADVQRSVQLAKNVEGEIAAKWAQGLADKDAAKVQEARDELKTWNENNPGTRMTITMQQVIKRVREMQATRAERAARSAPKELRGMVRESFQ